MKRRFTNISSGIQANSETGLPTYNGQLVSEERDRARAAKESTRKEKQDAQKLFKTSLSALIKRSLKAGTTSNAFDNSLPVPPEFIEALKIHCAHHAKAYTEESIYEEFYQVLEKEVSRGHSLLSCLYLADAFVHHSNTFRTVVAANVTEFLKACEKGGLFGVQDTRQLQLCQDFLMEIIDVWALAFGQDHKSFLTLRRYLREAVKLDAPTIEQRIANAEMRRSEIEKKQWGAVVDVTERIVNLSWPDATKEVALLIGHLEESFDTLLSNNRGKSSVGQAEPTMAPTVAPSSPPHGITRSRSIAEDLPPSSDRCADTAPTENEIDWDNIEWESDSITDVHSFVDDQANDMDDDFFGTELLHSSAMMTGDITVVIDPNRLQTFRGVVSDEAKEKFEQSKLDTRRAVSTTAKHLLSIYKLLQKWERHLISFLTQLVKREEDYSEAEQYWATHKRRRLLVEDDLGFPQQAGNAGDETKANTTGEGETASNDSSARRANERYQILFGRDQAVIERLAASAAAIIDEGLPQTMRRIRTILENQVRAVLST